jgi:hypothetical protein
MSQSLNFRITANDQASAVVTQVQKKVLDFGKDIGRSIASIVGPVALIGLAVSKVQEKFADMKKSAEDAFKWGAGLTQQAATLGLTVEQLQRLQQVADATAVPLEKVAEAFKASQKAIDAAKRGNAEAAEGLRALGFSAEELATLTPEKVIEAMSKALATIEDPTKKAAAAFAVFGEEGKKLVETLERLRKITEAPNLPGLSREESQFLRDQEQAAEGEKNKERLKLAREAATQKFLETDIEARGIMRREAANAGQLAAAASGSIFGASPIKQDPAKLAQNPRIQAEVQRILRERAEAEAARLAPTADDAIKGGTLADIGTKRQAKPEAVKKPQKPETLQRPEAEAVTVSSLRQIGGALAGEVAGGIDYQQLQVDLQREMVRLLNEVSNNLRPGTDPTKGSMDNVNPNTIGPNSRIGLA